MFDRFKKIIDDYTIPFFWMSFNLIVIDVVPNEIITNILDSNTGLQFTLLFLVSIVCGLSPVMLDRVKKFANDYTFHFFWIILNLLLIYDILFIRGLDSKGFVLTLFVLASIVCSFSAFWKFIFKIKKGTLAMTLFSSLFISIFVGVSSLNYEEIFLFLLKNFFSKETNIIKFILSILILYLLSVLWNFVFKKGRLKIIKVFLSIISCFILVTLHVSSPVIYVAIDNLKFIEENYDPRIDKVDVNDVNIVNKMQKKFQQYQDVRTLGSRSKAQSRDIVEKSKKVKEKISLCLSEYGRYKKECAEIRKKNKTLTRKAGSHSDSSQSQQ